MLRNKLLRIALTGTILVGGATMAIAGTINDDKLPSRDVMPISAPINEDVSTISLESRFADIQDHWAFESIAVMESEGVWEDLAGDFEPTKSITGAEFNQYLDKIFNFEQDPGFEFSSEEVVTRIEVAKAIVKSFGVKNLSVMTTLMFPIYDDTADLDSDGNSALSFVFNTGIMIGRTAQNFFPDDSLTRAELAVVLDRTLKVLELAEPIEEYVEETDFDSSDNKLKEIEPIQRLID